MTAYTVEAITEPVLNNDWSRWHRILDADPHTGFGAALLADPAEPVFVFETDANTPADAAQTVETMCISFGVRILAFRVSPARPEAPMRWRELFGYLEGE